MLQGKPMDERKEQAQRTERERLEKLKIDNEWAGGANSGMPQSCLADLPCHFAYPPFGRSSLPWQKLCRSISCWRQMRK